METRLKKRLFLSQLGESGDDLCIKRDLMIEYFQKLR